MKKNNITFFGYKLHSKQNCTTQLVLDFKLTPANLHDVKINLCKKNEIDYKDRGYYKKEYHQFNGAMTKSLRDHPIIYWEKERNKRISQKRAPVERPYSFLNRINDSHTKLTTNERNYVQITILMMIFNMEQLITLQKQEKTEKINNVSEENEQDEFDPSIPFKFFNNSIYYYENSLLINLMIEKSTNKKIKKLNHPSKNPKINNTPSMSKAEYRRNIKRKLGKIRNRKKKKTQKAYKKLIKSLNPFNLPQITI